MEYNFLVPIIKFYEYPSSLFVLTFYFLCFTVNSRSRMTPFIAKSVLDYLETNRKINGPQNYPWYFECDAFWLKVILMAPQGLQDIQQPAGFVTKLGREGSRCPKKVIVRDAMKLKIIFYPTYWNCPGKPCITYCSSGSTISSNLAIL